MGGVLTQAASQDEKMTLFSYVQMRTAGLTVSLFVITTTGRRCRVSYALQINRVPTV